MNNRKIAILGGGNLGTAIAQGLVSSDFTKGENITVTRRKIHLIEHLKNKGINTSNNNIDAVESSDIIIVAVKPYQILKVISEISSSLSDKKHIIISVVTGVSIKEIKEVIPTIPVYRAMLQ
jgi:pyrroline-5-carboxylate reductase